MLRSMNSPLDPHDDHVRNLLDQRNARTDFHGRFPSVSEMSDTPSVYSHALFSPRPADNSDSYPVNSSRALDPMHPHLEHRSNRERFNDPAASILDLDDDSRSSFVSSSEYGYPEHFDDDDDNNDEEAEEDVTMPRMSLLGPKVRVHSRAPWEMDEDILHEGDESDNSANYISAVPSSNVRGQIAKGLGLRSASPRASNSSGRPSAESSRSQARSKKSMDANPSSAQRGALSALAQASISSTSLLPSTSPGQSSVRSKFSPARGRPQTPTSSYTPSPVPSPPSPHATASSYFEPANSRNLNNTSSPSENPHHATRPSASRSLSTPYPQSDADFHPYANPDLVISYAKNKQIQSPTRSVFAFPGVSRSDSNATVTESLTTGSSSKLSLQRPRSRASTFQGKEISSPVSVHSPFRTSENPPSHFPGNRDNQATPFPPSGANNLPGWNNRSSSPTFTLISLEEAQAQRSRSATAHAAGNPSRVAPFAEPDADPDPSGSGNMPIRHRARSISAGAKAKQALHNIVGGPSSPKSESRDSESGSALSHYAYNGGVPGKGVRHKKSGFLRLFNSRDKETPPVPILSDAYTNHNMQPTAKPFKVTTHRIPVPPLSPRLLADSQSNEPSSPLAVTSSISGDGSENSDPSSAFSSRKPSPNPKRTPALSINTLAQGLSHRPTASATDPQSRALLTGEREWQQIHPPSSAPPNVIEFPSLQLRPVSTMFSAHFGDHIVLQDNQPLLEADLGSPSPTSPSTGMSPITPGLPLRSNASSDEKPVLSSISEDQSSVILALRQQIVAAKKDWQRHIWELEGQVRDLKAEVEDLRAMGNEQEYCGACGRGKQNRSLGVDSHPRDDGDGKKEGVVNRPRARTGASSRFGSGV